MDTQNKSSTALLHKSLERIAALDRDGPCLNAVLELNPQAEGLARALDAQKNRDGVLSPLHGVPVLLKDNIDTGDMLHTSAGSLALAHRFAPRDAHIAKRLRDAGALILGKANMTEFANYMSNRMPSGYSSRGGQVKSPWAAVDDPSGSSTGSAVAVAAGYVDIAIGTETLGSIISPAGVNGVAGVKPTVGVLSRAGILPISVSQDTAGPMARTVLGCAHAMDAMAGPDENDPYTLHGHDTSGYARAVLDAPARLDGLTLGLCNKDYEGNPVKTPPFLAALDALKALGARVVDVDLPHVDLEGEILINEFAACMDGALKGSLSSPLTLSDIAACNAAHPDACLRYGQRNIAVALGAGMGLTNPQYIKARAAMRAFAGALDALFAAHRLSAVITPECTYFACAGFPSVTIPVGVHGGRPVPIVFNGTAFTDHTLLMLAAVLERHVPGAAWEQG